MDNPIYRIYNNVYVYILSFNIINIKNIFKKLLNNHFIISLLLIFIVFLLIIKIMIIITNYNNYY